MKRIVIAAVIAIVLIGSANAQPSSANALASFPNLRNPVLLAAPADLPDVAECHGILSQVVLDIVNNANEDPAETFEKNRREHPHMIMMPAPLECASKLFQAIRRNPHFTSFASVPKGTEALSLRQYPVDALFNLRALSASVGSNVDPSGGVEGYQGENNIAIDPNNPQHIIAHSNTFFRDTAAGCQSPTGGAANTYGTMSLFGSTDGGATWTYNCAPWPAAITGGVAGADAWFGSDPALAWDNQGRAYATYMLISLNSSTNASGAAIVTARSTDNGATWQNLGTVTNGITSTTIGNDKEMMAIDNTSGQAFSHPGRIYVIWDAANNEKIAYSDNGTSWTTVNFASNTGAIGGNVVVGVDGTVYVIWNRYNVETIVFSKSTDGGATWTTPAVISTMALQSFGTNNLPPAQDSRGVNAFGSIDIDRNPASAFFGNLYVSFPDFPTGTTSGSDINTYVIRSTNGGTSWSSRVKVNDDNFGATQIFPWLAVDQSDGSLNVSWYDTRLDPLNRKTQMVYARSTDGGVSFEPNILLNDGGLTWRNNVNYSDENSTDNSAFNGNQYGDYSGIAALNRQVHPLWTDSRMFFPVADTQSPTRREDNATNVIINCTAPAALSAPTVNPTTAPSVVVSWSAPAGWGTNATSGTYSVYRNTTNTFPGGSPLVSGLTSTNYVDTTGTVSTTYFYFVRAKNNCPGTALTPMTTDSPASAGVVFGASGAAVGTLQGTVTSAGNPVSGATVTAGAFSATTNGSGFYQLGAITAATYTVGASATGYSSTSVPGVVVSSGATTVQNLSLTPLTPNACFTDTTYNDFGAGSGTSVDIATSPGNVRLGLTGSETIDQNSVPGSLFATGNITATQWIGQTFRAGASGNLTKVTLDLGLATGGTSGTITIEIRNISGTVPGSTVLATTTVGPITNVGTAANYLATFASPALVVSGTSYSIVLKANTGSTAFAVRGNNSSLANGQWFLTTNSGGSWSANTQDIYFATYVTPTALQPSGNLVSSTKDSGAVTGTTTTWTTLSWTATTPVNTTVKFQAAASNNAAGPFNFVGPDGTAATFFTTTGASLSQFNGKRYLQYKAFLSTTDTSVTPTLSDVTVCEQVVDCSSSVPAVTPSPAQVCASSTGNTASGPAGMSTYAWSITNGAITAGATAQSVTYTAGVSGGVGLSLTVTTSSGCQAVGSATVPIATPATPTASNTGPYCAGATISLSTPTVAGATYAWSGPNGFTSALQNPTRSSATTADAGTYSVTVTVSGCTSAAGSTSVVVNPIPATPTASNTGAYCAGATISLSTPTVAGATYAWTGPNGFTSSLQNPTRTNAAAADAGTYSVTVTVNGCTSAAGTTSVVVNPIPATPTASNGGPYCAGATISLSTPTIAGATYAWTGPNGFTSAIQNPTRSNATTADGGTYSVTVTVNNCPSAAGTTSVVVNAIPATPTASNGGPYCVGGTISLSTPTVAGATYAWTGPNGFTSAIQNPTRSSATVADAGTYSVTITVSGCTSAAGTTSVIVNPTPATPTASNGGPYCEGATIQLSTPTVAGATYTWSGPNGFTSALQNPTRGTATIADAGTYSVTITVSGCTSAAGTTSVVVNATPATPTASNGGPYCAGATIQLSTPTVAGATYAWTGPNGFTSAIQNPTRSNATVADAGTYSVTITVSGCPSAAGTTSVIVNPIPATPTASNSGPYCEGGLISLSTPTVPGATYAWSGPNGFTSALQNPTRASATLADAGTYSVTITVSGCTSAAGTTNVVVNPTPATPTASNGGPYCEGATIQLSTPTVAGATYAWSGPNGFTSALQNPTRTNATTADAGIYSVTITVSGCTSAAGTTNVVVNATPATPTASNGGPYCEGAMIALSTPTVAGATYAWTGPNGFTSALQNPTRTNATTADAGTYSVTITVSGCTSAAGTTNVVVNPTPATPTASNGGPYCEGATIQLSTPTVAGATYAWSGPNGFASALQNPTRASSTIADAGTYSVTVTVNGCTSAAGTTNVVVNPTPATPTASNGGPYCEGATIQLSTPTVAGATYAWTGPNGFSSALQNPTRSSATVADAGIYSVTITVSGCTSAAGTTTVVVNPIPATPTASNGGPYCAGATIALSTPTVAGATYSWTGPNGFTSALQNPTRSNATVADAGTYSVTITVNGCTSAAGTTNVIVNLAPATPTASNGGPYCEGATIQLSTPTVAGATYAWTGPNAFTSALQNPTRSNSTTADAGIYSVTITVSGCTSAAGTTTVVVNATPATPTASNGGPYCEGATIALSTPTVAGATYAWIGPNGFTSALQNPTRTNATTADAGIYSVTITVSGCTSAAGTTNVVVNPTPATPTASNGGPYCAGATIALSTPTVAGATYAWTGPNGFTSALQNPTRSNATVADAGTYSVTITVNGCTSAAGTTNVIVNPAPATPTASNGGPYCEGAMIQLSTPTVAGATYAWTGPNAFTSALQNPTRSNATTADAGIYSVTITVSGCTSAAGTTTVVVNATPATPTASNGGPYCEGATIALSTPTVAGATYAWTGPNGFTSALQNPTRSNATTADAGIYSVTITVSGCTSAAGTTTVVVNATPATPTASNGGPYCAGATIALSTPTVAGATYAWTGPNGFTSALQNPTRSNATIADAGTYSVTITVNGCTSAAGTTNVVVNPTPATPTITPGGPTTFCSAGSVTLTSSSATGNQWFLNGNAIGGATNNTYSATASGDYTVTVTASGCSSAASAATSVTVNPTPATPTITPAGSITFCFRDTVTLTSSSATGNQWSVEGTPLAGETGQTLLVTKDLINAHSVNGNAHFTVTVTENSCSSTSAPKLVTVLVPGTPVIIAAGPTAFCSGGSVELDVTIDSLPGQWYLDGSPIVGATNSSFVATASGSYTFVNTFYASCPSDPSNAIVVNVTPVPPTPTITPGGPTTFCAGGSVTLTSSSASGNQWFLNGNPIGGQTNNTFIATASGNYTVTVTASGCSSAASAPTSVIVNPIPATPTIAPGGPTTFCAGGSVTLTSSSASGNQWFLNGNPIGGETNNTFIATASGNYTVVVTASGCSSAASAPTSVTVNPIPATPTITPGGPTTFCAGGSVTLTSNSVSGNQWFLNGNPIGGETNNTFIATASGNYTVVVTVSGCSSAASAPTSVTVNPIPSTPTITPGGPTTFCTGGSVTLTSSSASGNQWFVNGNPIGGQTNNTFIATASGNYTVTVTASGCSSAASAPTSVTVNPIPATPTITPGGPTTFCAGGSVTLTSSSASGNQWFLNGNPIGGETNNSFIATASGNYTVVVTASGCSSAASAPTSVTVNPIPATPTITPGGPTTFCAGGSVTLTSSSASGNQWFLNGNLIGGATNNTYIATASGNYTVVVTASGCSSAASAPTSVTVNPIPATPTITPSAGSFCPNGGAPNSTFVQLSSSSVSGNQWFLDGNAIGGANGTTYNAAVAGSYTVQVTSSGCVSAMSAAATVLASATTSPTITPSGPTTFCAGGSVTLTASTTNPNVGGYRWYRNGVLVSNINPLVVTQAGDYTADYLTGACQSAVSAITTVTINPNPNATITAPASVVASSTGNTASVASAGAGATYNWSITNGTITAGTGTNSITFTAGAVGTLTLNVTVTTAAGCSDTKSANVNVTAGTTPVTVTSVAPASGSTSGGTAVTINGTGFAAGAGVTFGGTAATSVVVVSAIKITAITPAHAAGSVNVTVTNTNTTSGTLTSGYLYATLFDPNGDGVIDPADIFFLINYLFLNGPPPHGTAGMMSGDANGDGVVDPADIFYLINYLFLGGPKPHSVPGPVSALSIRNPTPQIAGSISLGKAVRRGGHYVVPVILTSRGEAPQAMSLRVKFDDDAAIGDVTIRRAGVAKDVVFETTRRSGNDVSYLVAYDPRGLALGASRSAVVAEIEIESVEGHVAIAIDPQLTMLSDQAGTMKATVANQKLEVSGTTIDFLPRTRVPGHEVN